MRLSGSRLPQNASRLGIFLFLFLLISEAASQSIPVHISIIKGPTGIASAWMLKNPPKTATHHVQFSLSPSADLVMAKLISGEISAGVLPINVAAKLYNLGVPIKAVAVVGNGMVKLISRQPAVKSLSDLKGKVVHIAGQKATPDYIFRFLMEKAGLVAGKDYTAVYSLAYPEIAAQIASGTIHYAVLPEPFATQAMILNPSLTLTANLDALWHDWTGQRTYPMSIFVASESLIKRIPDLLAELVRAYADSIHRTISEPEATAILAETLDLGMKAIISKNSIPNSAFEFVPAGKARSSIERMLTVFLDFEAQSIGGKLPSADFYFVLQ